MVQAVQGTPPTLGRRPAHQQRETGTAQRHILQRDIHGQHPITNVACEPLPGHVHAAVHCAALCSTTPRVLLLGSLMARRRSGTRVGHSSGTSHLAMAATAMPTAVRILELASAKPAGREARMAAFSASSISGSLNLEASGVQCSLICPLRSCK